MSNLLLKTDSYKVSHWLQYPPGTTNVFSYFESRGGMYEKVLFFGLQYYLKKYLVGEQVTLEKIAEASKLFKEHFGTLDFFNEQGWLHILKDHEGKLPVEIKAVPEGTVLPIKNVLLTVENTCPKDYWLTSYLETLISKLWYTCSVGTKSWYQKQVIKHYLDLTGDDTPDFKLHDFGARGSSSEESAMLGDMAHLVNFKGTDTLQGIVGLQRYYHAKVMPAFSVPAAEHSTITSWGKENELKAYENMLDKFPTGIVSIVADSYNVYYAVKNLLGKELKDRILAREGTVVIRPDSGDPVEVLTRVFHLLRLSFGAKINSKGYKVLPSQVRVIQGDGIDEKTLPLILEALAENGWSANNIVFGSGGGLLQNVTRDTMQFAYKTSNVTIDGKDRPVSKDPITDSGKKSKAGRLELIRGEKGNYSTVNPLSVGLHRLAEEQFMLQTVFKDGELHIDYNIEDIRKRSEE